ncbi:hypothetical protein MMC27_003223 [Xylographa pallens]|nr:hypothetical protein [Xylographa pallens]
MEPTKSDPLSESTEIYRAVRCLFFWILWSTGLVFVLLYTDLLRADAQATTRTLKPAEALFNSHATNTTTCVPIYESSSFGATSNFYWRFTYLLNLCIVLFCMPLTFAYLLMTEDYDPDNCICLRCFFGLGCFLGFITCVALDKDVISANAALLFPATFNWVTIVAMTMALALTGGYKAVWHTFVDIRFVKLWVKLLLRHPVERDLEKQKP